MARAGTSLRKGTNATLPSVEPILPTLTRTVPLGREWVYELNRPEIPGELFS